jgi:DNA-binding SARP family transcriptional activator
MKGAWLNAAKGYAVAGSSPRCAQPRPCMLESDTAFRLRLIGEATGLHSDGRTLVFERKDALLLTYLALEGPTPRAALAPLLWPEVDTARARANLRQRLFRLRQLIGVDVVCGGGTLGLAPGVAHDLGDAQGVLGALRFPEAPAFDAWLLNQRDQRASHLRQATERQAEALERAGELAAALAVAQALLRLEPLSEAAHRRVMRLHYLRGDRSAALMAFDDCERSLKDEVGARPSATTLALLHTVEQAQAHPWAPGQPLPAAALKPPQLIGRASEVAALGQAWGAGQMFVLTGQAGVGKSRVLEAIGAATDGVLLVCARPGDDKMPLATLSRLVQRLSERWPTLRTLAAYSGFAARLAGPLGHETPTARSVVPMVVDLLQAARAVSNGGLTGLLLDDLQFADVASVDTWQEFLVWPALAGLRFGLASRVEGQAAAHRIAAFSERSDAVRVPLPPLSGDAVLPFIESLALPMVDASAIAVALVRRIGGNPLHLLETIRHALEKHGHLRADNLEAPARVTELLEQRLLALPADGLLVVRIAAVAGDQFDPELAAAVSRRDVLELADAWHALERQGLLDGRGFMHDLIGEAAHRLLPQPIARVLHARVASHLAQRGASAARLAHHLLCAGDEAAAVPQLAAAARQAWHLGRSREASEAGLRAADIELSRGHPDAAFDLLFQRAEVIEELGPRPALIEAIDRLAVLTHTPSQHARLAYLRNIRLHHDADHVGCQAGIDDALALAVASADRAIEAECRYTKAFYLGHGGRLSESVAQLTTATALHRSVGREQRARVIECSAHTVLLWMGQAGLALNMQRDALRRALDAGPSILQATMMMRQADSELHLGDVGAAMRLAGRALEALRATDMIGGELARTIWYIANVQRRCGHWGEALAIVNETEQRIAAQSDPEQLLAATRAGIYLDLGRPDLAYRHVEAFAAASQQSSRQRLRALVLRREYDFANGGGVETTPVAALDLGAENLLQACELALVAGHAISPALTAAQCAALIERCEPQGLREELVPLYALCAHLHAREGAAPASDASVALAKQALLAGEIGAVTPVACLWLSKALHRLGRPADAVLQARRGSDWLMARAQQTVPPEFHDSFLHRHPIHRELLALAAR